MSCPFFALVTLYCIIFGSARVFPTVRLCPGRFLFRPQMPAPYPFGGRTRGARETGAVMALSMG